MDGLFLKVERWKVTSLAVEKVASAYYQNHAIFPVGSIEFDHALLMRDIIHEWHAEPQMRAERRPEVLRHPDMHR